MVGKTNLNPYPTRCGQNEVNYLSKIGQDATFARTFNGHNLAIFHPILTFDHTKMISSSRQIELF